MNAFAQAWQEQARVPPTDVAEMQAAMRLASKEGIHYSDAVERVRGEIYAREQGPCEVITDYALRRGE